MADKEKPMILSFNTIWVIVVFIFSLGLLHANVTNGVKDNTDGISSLRRQFESTSKTVYDEIKSLSKGQEASNRQDAELNNDIEWIKKGQSEIKELIKLKTK